VDGCRTSTKQRQLGPPPGWVRVAALVFIAALVVVTLLPIAWFGGLEDSPGGKLVDLFGNVLLFAPLGFLLPLLVPAIRRWCPSATMATMATSPDRETVRAQQQA
jgi:glycopeptide antibiotics resistance protein